MTSFQLLKELTGIDSELLVSVEQQTSRQKETKSHRGMHRPFLLAALIALLLMLVGCAVVYVLSLNGIKLGEQLVTYDVYDTNPNSKDPFTVVGQETKALDREIEKRTQKKIDIESIEKIEAKPVVLSSSRVSLAKSEYETLAAAAKKYYAQERRESKLQKALDAANKLIGELKAQITSLKQQISALHFRIVGIQVRPWQNPHRRIGTGK